ncbi:hypothetical protein [Oxynema aestuarii]|uniref:Uncharacterized protein n=1 Tax=Oxynema aestuarii AP17 TaxID=2064643 RepID=A0A6H1U2G7_9CYAN|nr:hypothetical protein [Oxynema aestuarii]QIZ72567.1 hypothetical protein HCG48_19850 [Oxynema aestuarii AP17]
MKLSGSFQACEIVCLEYEHTRLYAEVIETIAERQMCWVRPLVLVVGESARLYDLRQGADLVWPASRFRVALDTEVIPLLGELNAPDRAIADKTQGHQQLRRFVDRLWRAYPDDFSDRS